MKKNLLYFFLCLILMLVLCISVSADTTSGDYKYRELDDGTIMITEYNGTDTDLVLPETLDGFTVSTIDNYFSLSDPMKELTSLTIPDTLTIIEPDALRFTPKLTEIHVSKNHPTLAFIDGVLYNKEHKSILRYLQANTAETFDIPDGIKLVEEGAFFRSQLVTVNIPGSVEQIDREGFNQCDQLKEFNMSEGLKTIGRAVIFNCSSLEEITFPSTVSDVGENNCTACDNLKEIRVDPANPVFEVIDGALINKRDGLLIAYPRQREAEVCTIPEGVKRIGDNAFHLNKFIKEIHFPDTLVSLGGHAFAYCDNLTEIIMPDSVTEMENNVFDACYNVHTLHISSGLTSIKNNFSGLAITEVDIPDTVTEINGSFSNLNNVTSIIVPSGVTKIGSNSFYYCKNLSSLTIPASVTEIGNIKYIFQNNAEDFTVKVEAGSYAEQYCKDNQVKYEVIDGESAAAPEDDDPFSWLNND